MKKVVMGIISRKNFAGEDEFLLIKSKRDFGKFTGLFYPPGGHVEDGETLEEALIREVKEEVGLDIEPARQLAETGGDIPDQVYYWWECQLVTGELKIQNEIADAKFVTKKEMETLNLWPATKRFFDSNNF